MYEKIIGFLTILFSYIACRYVYISNKSEKKQRIIVTILEAILIGVLFIVGSYLLFK